MVDDICDRDVVEHIDARVLQQMALSTDSVDELFCFDVNVKHVVLPDVKQMNDPDESISFDYDVEVDGPFRVEDVQLHIRWGLMPPLGKMPWKVQDVHDDVKIDDVLLKVGMYSSVRAFDALFYDVVGSLLKMLIMLSLLDDVDKVDGLTDVVLNSPTVLDEQGDVEANWCELL